MQEVSYWEKRLYNTTVDTTTTENINNEQTFEIPEECIDEFVKAMKIGYYKEFYKQGLITADQLETLIAMQDNMEDTSVA